MLARCIFIISFFLTLNAHAETTTSTTNNWWTVPYPQLFDTKLLNNTLPRISVSKNKFVDEQGNTVIFRGMNSSDPDKLVKNNKWDKDYFIQIKNWGANIVRIPVHPLSWRERGENEYLSLLDQAVSWSNELNMYVIIDWHSIGNLRTDVYQHEMYETTLGETFQFWQSIATRYKGINTVAFYELFNEPTQGQGRFGTLNWKQWKSINEEMIDIIQAHDDEVISLVAGFNWAYDLRPIKGKLIKRDNVGYVSHPYPQKEKKEPMEKGWEKKFGFITKHAPLMATEIGWMHDGERGAHIPVINNDDRYGPRITQYLDDIGASWVAWVFDPDWTPNMFSNWKYEPTTQGAFFKKEMKKNKPLNP